MNLYIQTVELSKPSLLSLKLMHNFALARKVINERKLKFCVVEQVIENKFLTS